MILLLATPLHGKMQNFTEDESPDAASIVWTTKDPTGTPLDRKVTLSNLKDYVQTAIPGANVTADTVLEAALDCTNAPTDNYVLTYDSGTLGFTWVAGVEGAVLDDGTTPLTADWDVGAYKLTGTQFVSDVAIGTSPFPCTSTTVNTNLNADLLDGESASAFQDVDQNLTDMSAAGASVDDVWTWNGAAWVPTNQSVLGDTGGAVPILFQDAVAFTGADATPDVSTALHWITADTTTYTDFDGTPVDGQQLWIYCAHAATFDLTSSGIEAYNRTTDLIATVGFVAVLIYEDNDSQWKFVNAPSAVAEISSNGLIARTGAGTAAARTITGTTNEIEVDNGNGASGNPTIGFPNDTIVPIDGGANNLDDDTYSGIKVHSRSAGETITQWDLVYFDTTDSEWKQADADAAGEFPSRGLAVAAGTDGNALTVLVQGVVRNDGWAWGTVGGNIYLSDTAGALTQTAPSTSGDCVQLVGWALSDDEAYINISGHYLEVE